MSSTTVTPARAPSRTLHGILCVVVGMCFFSVQDGLMKSLLPEYSIWLLLFTRSCMSVVILVPLILILGGQHTLSTRFLGVHAARGALFAMGFAVFYMAFPFMGLAEATTIFFSAPMMIALMAVVFLKEQIGPHRVAALIVGFAGVVIAINPTSAGFTWISLLPLVSAALYAGSQVLARQIGESESSLTVGMYTLGWAGPSVLVFGLIVSSLVPITPEFGHLGWGYPLRSMGEAGQLLILCSVGMCGYILLSRAYQVADPGKISLFDYSYLPIATAMAWIVWSEAPPLNTLIGMALVIASGIYIGIRELRQPSVEGEPAPISETLTAPGSPLPGQSAEDEWRD